MTVLRRPTNKRFDLTRFVILLTAKTRSAGTRLLHPPSRAQTRAAAPEQSPELNE